MSHAIPEIEESAIHRYEVSASLRVDICAAAVLSSRKAVPTIAKACPLLAVVQLRVYSLEQVIKSDFKQFLHACRGRQAHVYSA